MKKLLPVFIFLISFHYCIAQDDDYIIDFDSEDSISNTTSYTKSEKGEMVTKDYLPLEILNSHIYFEKFSPLYIQDISAEDVERIRKSHAIGDFITNLDFYNAHLYRNINEIIQSSIIEFNLNEKITPFYYRDFNESIDESHRFIIKSSFSIVDMYENYKFNQNKNQYSFYLYDKKNNIKYFEFSSAYDILKVINYLEKNKNKKKFQNLTQEKLNLIIKKQIKKKKEINYKRISKITLAVVLYGIYLIIAL